MTSLYTRPGAAGPYRIVTATRSSETAWIPRPCGGHEPLTWALTEVHRLLFAWPSARQLTSGLATKQLREESSFARFLTSVSLGAGHQLQFTTHANFPLHMPIFSAILSSTKQVPSLMKLGTTTKPLRGGDTPMFTKSDNTCHLSTSGANNIAEGNDQRQPRRRQTRSSTRPSPEEHQSPDQPPQHNHPISNKGPLAPFGPGRAMLRRHAKDIIDPHASEDSQHPECHGNGDRQKRDPASESLAAFLDGIALGADCAGSVTSSGVGALG
ncbi:hypothetical protein CONLIGDRAFT_649866 [Coniochaeta ligniaria NRRL 30616]|uniref:Uncharacterized protein n=1 Tax=Coniochaeta ligniaria NRRL 30616 TaxID=1408157 RepID=A0A1J7I7F4_9PEZI|nr:hypothetical protein CONLIGDRAFT_649866 [Coniochaeta ligniaria NRRL 30616]